MISWPKPELMTSAFVPAGFILRPAPGKVMPPSIRSAPIRRLARRLVWGGLLLLLAACQLGPTLSSPTTRAAGRYATSQDGRARPVADLPERLGTDGPADPGPADADAAGADAGPAAGAIEPDETAVDLIAYIGGDRNVYTIDRFGGRQTALTTDARVASPGIVTYQHITWAPDSQSLSFVRLSAESAGHVSTLLTASPDGLDQHTLFTSRRLFPFYLHWSPDSAQITFLSNDPAARTLGLYRVAPRTDAQPAIIERGQPFYWAWSPDSQQIFIHTGARRNGRLAFLDPASGRTLQNIDLQPTAFQAPAWLPDGKQLMVAIEDESGDDVLALIDLDGHVTELTPLTAETAFTLSPDGRQVAFASGSVALGAGAIGSLTIMSTVEPEKRFSVPQELVLAFFWSPDSQKLAYFAFDRRGKIQAKAAPLPVNQPEDRLLLDLHVLDLASGSSQYVMTLVPTEQLLNVLPYFDQYHRSATIWSPDSQELVVAGYEEERRAAIWVVPAHGLAEPRRLADGVVAFWSWR